MSIISLKVNWIKGYADELSKEFDKLQAELDRKNQEFGVFKPYTDLAINYTIYITSASDDRLTGRNWSSYNNDRLVTEQQCLNFLEKTSEVHKANILVAGKAEEIENYNRELLVKLRQLIVDCGIRAKITEIKRGKSVSKNAPWYDNLFELMPHTRISIYDLNEKWANTQRYVNEHIKNMKLAEAEKQRLAQIEKNKTLKIARLVNACNALGITYNPDTVIDDIENKLFEDKYIQLSYSMLRARNDFSEIQSVQHALNAFSVNTDDDRAIYNELSDIFSDYPTDGRVFRDCYWNYSKILELADKKLLAVYLELLNNGDID